MTFDPEQMPGVGPATAEKLLNAGYDTVRSVAIASPGELSKKTDIGASTASDLINWAREKADVGALESEGGVLQSKQQIERIRFDVDALDELMDGGVETQSLTEVFGAEGSGRSLIAHRLSVLAQLPSEAGGLGGSAIYIDTRGEFDPATISTIVQSLSEDQKRKLRDRHGVAEDEVETAVLENIHVSKVDSVNEQIIMAEKAKEKAESLRESENPVRLVCVDTVSEHFKSEYQGRSEFSERQMKLNKHLHDFMRIGDLYNAAIVYTNDDGNKPNSSFGGQILSHTSTFQLRLLKQSTEKRTARLVSAPTLGDDECEIRISGVEIE